MQSGYVLSLGNIKIMSLIYCPFGKTCSDCKKPFTFTLKDSDSREFAVRRYKLSECRFEIYNEKMIRSKHEFARQIFDFTSLSRQKIVEVLNHYLNNENTQNLSFTSGNLLKGVE